MASPSPKWDEFRIDTGKIVLGAQFSPGQTVHAKKMIQQACQLLSSFVQRETNILRFWSNIIEGAYADMSDTMTEQQIHTRLVREPANTGPIELADSITRPVIYIPHPSECISECRFNFEAEHACTYQEGNGSIVIAIHPNVLDLNLLEQGSWCNVLSPSSGILIRSLQDHRPTMSWRRIPASFSVQYYWHTNWPTQFALVVIIMLRHPSYHSSRRTPRTRLRCQLFSTVVTSLNAFYWEEKSEFLGLQFHFYFWLYAVVERKFFFSRSSMPALNHEVYRRSFSCWRQILLVSD